MKTGISLGKHKLPASLETSQVKFYGLGYRSEEIWPLYHLIYESELGMCQVISKKKIKKETSKFFLRFVVI